MYNILLRYYTLLDRYKICYEPKAPTEEIDRRYVYAIHHIEYAWYLLETFNRTDTEQQKEIKLEVTAISRSFWKIPTVYIMEKRFM